ncbi:hypothetical protein BAUCODRAFT_213234 [Baudoinia panamericana UAMH 10762]|uniref:Uncharacterized protein n=1 Tax=Baudoinia panamericana (strain UAMH 10762) TaxID=717646 RepID=M2N533_BAUPA|nr:uncharacterized protein BAUCODRAFT_213234 [Baudoinia panamericana UAMH 10762]EMC93875.1 hypothetical protein BAUCODRAFT_213234 [Baudoinia panamericana UAMH 10762]
MACLRTPARKATQKRSISAEGEERHEFKAAKPAAASHGRHHCAYQWVCGTAWRDRRDRTFRVRKE